MGVCLNVHAVYARETAVERAKKIHGQVEAIRSRETKLKISTMTNVGELEESIFLYKSVISFRSGVDHVYLAHAFNKPCSRTRRKYALNNQFTVLYKASRFF